ncbi:MAG: response regulator, partial [Planctomycetota bacterium]
TFRFTGLFVPAAAPEPPAPRGAVTDKTRVLVIDPVESDGATVCDALARVGCRTARAGSVEQARRRAAEAVRAGRPFDVVVLGADRAATDGVAAAERVREAMGEHQPAIVLTTSVGLRGDADACRRAGIHAYLTKPVAPEILRDAIDRAMTAARTETGSPLVTRHSLRGARGPMRILLAEDNEINREHATMLLEEWGCEVTCATTGGEAVEACADGGFDLVLMDMQMPQIDGLEATRRIRAAEAEGRHVPILAMTANAMPDAADACRDAGMDGYVAKPVSPARLREAMAQVGLDTAPRGSDATDGNIDDEADDGAGEQAASVWNTDAALAAAGGSPEALGRLVNAFADDWPASRDALRRAGADADGDEAARLAHKLKGSLALLAAPTATKAAETLEQTARDGRGDRIVASVDELIEAVEGFCARAAAYLGARREPGAAAPSGKGHHARADRR